MCTMIPGRLRWSSLWFVWLVACGCAGANAASTADAGMLVQLAGCSYDEVKNALDTTPDGATVEVGSGECTWPQMITRYGGVHLKGAGAANTIVHVATPVGDETTQLLKFNCWSGGTMELSGIRFVGVLDTPGYTAGVVFYGCRDFKIHDNDFRNFKGVALTIASVPDFPGTAGWDSRGVVYRNRFTGNHYTGTGYGVAAYGGSRRPPLLLGELNSEAVFIEDNYFEDNRHSVTSNYGGRYVFRHNTLASSEAAWEDPAVDAHGIQLEGEVGTHSWEIYNNTFHIIGGNPGTAAKAIQLRGGDGVVFGNTIDPGYAHTLILRLEWWTDELPEGTERCEIRPYYPYPANFGGQTQHAWFWDNTVRGTTEGGVFLAGCDYYFDEGRDYFLRAPTVDDLGYAYHPFTYPHPLRGEDGIFANGFD